MNEIGHSAQEALEYVTAVPPARGATMMGVPFEGFDEVRFGIIGVGGRGGGLLGEILAVPGARVVALFDTHAERLANAGKRVVDAGFPAPALMEDWRALCRRADVDLVYICTPWHVHADQAVYAMECGKHAAVEVPAVTTLADCWRLVDTSEHTRRHCVMLENCCYGEPELTALTLVRQGRLGTLTHGEAAYIHHLNDLLLADESEGLWRRSQHLARNGNLYPTHGLGPVAWYMDIHHGDRFTRMTSMSSLSAALAEHRDAKLDRSNPKRRETYTCGDMNNSLIQTANGRTILLQHDVVTPRPYTRLNLIQGSKGTFLDNPPRFYDDIDAHGFMPDDILKGQYTHPLWKEHGEQAMKLGGHGGMDFILNLRLVETMRKGLAPDINVYDAAAWSAPGPLSDISVAWDNLALPFPDFTRGHWHDMSTAPLLH